MTRPVAFAALAFLLAAPAVGAQTARTRPQFSAEAGIVRATVDGDEFEGVDPGIGFDLQGRAGFNVFSLGVGFQLTSHDNDQVPQDIAVSVWYLEPRVAIRVPYAFAPYATARLGRTRQSIETEVFGEPWDLEATGWMYSGGLGVELPVGSPLRFNLSASYARFYLDEAELNGETVENSDGSGSSVILRVGVSFHFGQVR